MNIPYLKQYFHGSKIANSEPSYLAAANKVPFSQYRSFAIEAYGMV